MDISSEHHLLYQLLNAELREYPFPHIYRNGVFPSEFFDSLLQSIPTDLGGNLSDDWQILKSFLFSRPFHDWMTSAFSYVLEDYVSQESLRRSFVAEWSFAKAGTSYAGLDSAQKPVLSLFFYLTNQTTAPEWGHGIFSSEKKKMALMPFLPNTAFLSFHANQNGECLDEIASSEGERKILQFSYRVRAS